MAAAATVINCSAMAKWIPIQKFWVTYPFIMVAYGQAQGGHAGFHAGHVRVLPHRADDRVFASRRLFTVWTHEINAGVTRERYDYLRSYIAWCVVSMIVMAVLAIAMTR